MQVSIILIVQTIILSIIFNEYIGKTEIYSYYDSNNSILKYFKGLPLVLPVFSLLVVSCFMILLIVVKIAVSESKTIAILHLNGYANHRVFTYLTVKYKDSIIGTFIFSTIFIIATTILKGDFYFLSILFLFNIATFILITFLVGIIFFTTIKFIDMRHEKIDIIKGNITNKPLLIFQFVLKYIMLALVVLLFVALSEYQYEIKTYMDSNESWFKTENIHRVKAKFVTDDLEEKRKLEFRAKELYHDLEKNNGAFVIDTRNFDTLSSGEYIWEKNAELGSLYSIYGKSITVNINYLKNNVVFDVNGMNVMDRVLVDDYTSNILVPISLKKDEEIILENFLEDFVYQKVEIPKIYQKEIGEEILPIDIEKLSVNLIYIPDNVGYFTYDKDILPNKSNIVTDPIVIIDTGNVDASCYFSKMTRCVFFESNNPEPFLDIYKDVTRHNMLPTFTSLESIYDTRAEEMKLLINASKVITLVMSIIIVLLIFFMYILSHSYFEENKYSIFVKYFSGYSFLRIYKIKLGIELMFDSIILYFSGNILFIIAIIAVDIICSCMFSRRLYSDVALNVIKKGDI